MRIHKPGSLLQPLPVLRTAILPRAAVPRAAVLRNAVHQNGYTLLELLISTAMAGILVSGFLYLLFGFYENGQNLSQIANRSNNQALVSVIASRFLTQAGYIGSPTAATLSPPVVQSGATPSSYDDGVTIQWVDDVGDVCTGTLVDQTQYEQNQNYSTAEPINGLTWVVTGAASCRPGTAFFPVNNQWGFSVTQDGVHGPNQPYWNNLAGCPNQEQGIVLTNNYAYQIGGASQYQHFGNTVQTQQVYVCTPNVPQN